MVDAAIDFAAQKAGGFKDAQVLGNGREGDVERGGELLDGGFALGEAGEDGAAGGVGEGAKGGVESGEGIVNHVVYYLTEPGSCQVVLQSAGLRVRLPVEVTTELRLADRGRFSESRRRAQRHRPRQYW